MRKSLAPMRCFKVLARCAQLGLRETATKPWRARLKIGNATHKAAVVGYSGITGCPVSAAPAKKGTVRDTIDINDNSQGIPFRTEPMNHLSGGNVIWHATVTVPGNISAIKRLIVNNNRHFLDDADVINTINHQHKRRTLGLSFEPPAHHRPATDGD
ncbi:hypothetical protein FSST1_008760 [Fusarium sambucinum]